MHMAIGAAFWGPPAPWVWKSHAGSHGALREASFAWVQLKSVF
jgi:hypothetical protein